MSEPLEIGVCPKGMFTVTWNIDTQEYQIYRNGMWLRTVFRYADVKPYMQGEC